MGLSIEEKKELVYDTYTRSLDFDLAVKKIGLLDNEIALLVNDEDFMSRLMMVDIEVQEDIIQNLRELSQSENDGIALKANLELGKIFYTKKFDSKYLKLKVPAPGEGQAPTKIVLYPGADDD